MLVGLLLIGGGQRQLPAVGGGRGPGQRPGVVAGTVLVLVGAITKSAMVPFHFWLPAAMAAPTPVSAYLHAAAMVKAGVYLVALLAPGFADVPGWRPIVLGLGAGDDAGRRLARAAADRPEAAPRLRHGQPAGFPHGAGRRRQPRARRRRPGDDRRARPVQGRAVPRRRHRRPRHGHPRPAQTLRARPAAARAGRRRRPRRASMAGLPPLLGFVAKEAAFAALLDGGLPDRTAAAVVLAVSSLGSALTVAYTLRFSGAPSPASPGCPTPRPPSRPPAGAAVPRRPGGAGAGRARRWAPPARARALVAAYAETCRYWRPRRTSWRCGTAGSRPCCCRRSPARRCARCSLARTPVDRLQRRFAVGASADEGYWNTIRASTGSPCWSPAPPSAARCRPTSARSWSSCWRCPARPDHRRAVARRVAGLGHPGPGPGRRGRPHRGRDGAADPAAAGGRPRRRRHRLRRSPCCSSSRARPTWRSPSSWSRR